jgi:hypothetical protein
VTLTKTLNRKISKARFLAILDHAASTPPAHRQNYVSTSTNRRG